MQTIHPASTKTNTPLKQIELNGTNLAYIEKGEGEPVLFIHGAVSDYRTWFEQFYFFSQNYRAISYSRRYHRPNVKAQDSLNYSRALHTADLIEFLKTLNLGKAHLIGHSYGGSIALMTALQHPELVGSLVLAEPSPLSSLFDRKSMNLLSEQQTGFDEALQLAQNGDKESAVRQFLHVIVGVDVLGLLPEERRSVVLENADTLEPMLKTYYDSPPFGCKELRNVNIPTLLVTGEFSPPIARLNNKMINECMPNSEVAVLRGASHGLQMENPEGFNRVILQFYQRNGLSTANNL